MGVLIFSKRIDQCCSSWFCLTNDQMFLKTSHNSRQVVKHVIHYYWVFGLCPLSGRWTKSRNPVVMSVTHHRQNPLEFTYVMVAEFLDICIISNFAHKVTLY
jgi:hypothetical protein